MLQIIPIVLLRNSKWRKIHKIRKASQLEDLKCFTYDGIDNAIQEASYFLRRLQLIDVMSLWRKNYVGGWPTFWIIYLFIPFFQPLLPLSSSVCVQQDQIVQYAKSSNHKHRGKFQFLFRFMKIHVIRNADETWLWNIQMFRLPT